MQVRTLWLTDFRSYTSAQLDLAPGLTALVGANGEGKTNVLEALAWLATLSSFRGAPTEALVRRGAPFAVVRALAEREGRELLIEAQIQPNGRNRVLVNRQPLRRARDLLGSLRVSVFTPDDLAIVKDGPGERRRFLDDTLVSLHPRNDALRRQVDKVVRQRNALLKGAGARLDESSAFTLDVWDAKLAEAGAALVAARLDLLDRMRPVLAATYDALARRPALVAAPYEAAWAAIPPAPAGAPNGAAGSSAGAASSRAPVTPAVHAPPAEPATALVHRVSAGGATGSDLPTSAGSAASAGPTTPAEHSTPADAATSAAPEPSIAPRPAADGREAALRAALADALAQARTDDVRRGVSTVGPHRDDVALAIGGAPARTQSSQGEQRTLALALRLAAHHVVTAVSGSPPVLLLDDVFSELDPQRSSALLAHLPEGQTLLTTASGLPAAAHPDRVLRLVDGRIEPGPAPAP